MAVKLNVPLVTQQQTNECWYASMCMVAYYRTAGPRLGLPKKWAANKGIGMNDFISLARTEGMKSIQTPFVNLSSQQLEIFLKNYGPIWCAGFWDGAGHIIVLTGVDGDRVFINDPNPYVGKRTETIQWFNQKISRIPNCLMYMN
jgi:ABC-type bacteriocin/lantibiotic exporter with double-glycine peptidase domain